MPRVVIVAGARSLTESVEKKSIVYNISEDFKELSFVETVIAVLLYSPKQIFLEKILS